MHSSIGLRSLQQIATAKSGRHRMKVLVRRLHLIDEDGASAVEYGLLIAGIAAIVVAAVFLFGGAVGNLFSDTCTAVGSGSGSNMSCGSP